jgi:hypothetical protein
METSFHYDLEQKHLSFKVRQRMDATGGVQLDAKGLFDTVTGTASYRGTLTAGLDVGKQNVKGAGTTPLRLGESPFAACHCAQCVAVMARAGVQRCSVFLVVWAQCASHFRLNAQAVEKRDSMEALDTAFAP